MNMPDEVTEKVGYGRPPKAHRFRKGASGNPRGRPKKAPVSPGSILNAELDVTLNGKKSRRPASEIMILKLIKQAISEDHLRSCMRLLHYIDRYNLLPASTASETGGVVTVSVRNRKDFEAFEALQAERFENEGAGALKPGDENE